MIRQGRKGRSRFGFDLDAIREALQEPAPSRDRHRYQHETACPECGAPVTVAWGVTVDVAGPNEMMPHPCAYPPERGTGLARLREWLKGRAAAEPVGELPLWTESETTAA
ncbi:MAG: hypothetical protein IID40_10290 [Planctomycetes bacterium]|nr:hypothetical protein [Planctomycetota bacterium]